jgi:RNA polymerase sigma-70 factor (ECF subfamily)
MNEPNQWDLGKYLPLLRLRAQQLYRDPRLQSRLDWSDVVQEAFLKAQQALDQFEGKSEGELVKWLLTILKNTYRDRLDREFADMRDPARELAFERIANESSARLEAYLAASQSTPSEHVAKEEMLLRVATALDELPERERQVVFLRHLMGVTLGAIAEQTGWPQTTVSRLHARGLRKLRKRLSPVS